MWYWVGKLQLRAPQEQILFRLQIILRTALFKSFRTYNYFWSKTAYSVSYSWRLPWLRRFVFSCIVRRPGFDSKAINLDSWWKNWQIWQAYPLMFIFIHLPLALYSRNSNSADDESTKITCSFFIVCISSKTKSKFSRLLRTNKNIYYTVPFLMQTGM